MLQTVGAGQLLGLAAVVGGQNHTLTAQTAVPSHVKVVEHGELMRFLRRNGEAGLLAAQALARESQGISREIHDLVLTKSSTSKLVKLILSWTPTIERSVPEIRFRSVATHEEMAQMIGSSRETVTRLLGDLRRRKLIRVEGSMMVVLNREALEALAA